MRADAKLIELVASLRKLAFARLGDAVADELRAAHAAVATQAKTAAELAAADAAVATHLGTP